jgi:hypothetical protein
MEIGEGRRGEAVWGHDPIPHTAYPILPTPYLKSHENLAYTWAVPKKRLYLQPIFLQNNV